MQTDPKVTGPVKRYECNKTSGKMRGQIEEHGGWGVEELSKV